MRHRLDQVARIWAITALVAWVVLVAMALGATANVTDAGAAPTADQPSLDQRRDTPQTSVADVSSGVMCPSCDTTLDQSNSPAAESMRSWVEEAVAAGWTEQEIRDGLVEEYDGDESILATPRASGLGLLAWIVPLVVAVVAALGGIVLMRRWRRSTPADQTRSGASSYSHASASPSTSSSSSNPNSSPDEPVATSPSPSSSR